MNTIGCKGAQDCKSCALLRLALEPSWTSSKLLDLDYIQESASGRPQAAHLLLECFDRSLGLTLQPRSKKGNDQDW